MKLSGFPRQGPVGLILLAFGLVFFLVACSPPGRPVTAPPAPPPSGQVASSQLQVHFLDVGQAESILIKTPAGQAVLVDGGGNTTGPGVVDYLKKQGVKELAAVVATHPHEDHIGGLDDVLKSFPVFAVYLPKVGHTSRSFQDFLAAVKASGARRVEAKAGVSLDLPGIDGRFLAPGGERYEGLNDYSAVLKITYGQTAFLLTGDVEGPAEKAMLGRQADLRADVLKVAHHGSTSSTTAELLRVVNPRYAVISAGAGNDYGHPHKKTLDRLAREKVEVYRTDQSGTIVFSSDGRSLTVQTTR